MHEVTHAIGTKEMENYVVQYASKHQDFAESLASLQKTYKTKNVNSEVLADISGKLFGTQEFINSLVAENTAESRTVIQKVYEGIQRIKNMFTAEGRYKNFVDKLERMWREAYQTQYNNLNNESYFIENVANFDNLEYNNVEKVILPKKEYAILSSIVNSDSNIKPGINYVKTTNATYKVYFKETGEFKLLDKIVDGGAENDSNTTRIVSRTNESRDARSGMLVHSEAVQNRRTRAYNDEISNINKRGTYYSYPSIEDSNSNITNVENSNKSSFSMQETENNAQDTEYSKKSN